MRIKFKKSFGGTGITIDSKGKEVPSLTLRNGTELNENEDYTIEEKEKPGITEIVFEWMNNQSVFFQN
jgi:hypothetical protein